jgi:uncharacterized protein (TIGR02171 family)
MAAFKRHGGMIIVVVAMIVSCTPLTPDRERPVETPHAGMKKISSAGTWFQQGWDGTFASYDEKPVMESGFSYDYWLDSTEVTQKQYYEVTGRRPVSAASQYGASDNYPVYYVSWFDAVLYCNARSRLEGLDTVYQYSGVRTSSNGTVYELTGLWYDLTHDGYRLPTEGEWEYAGRGGSSVLLFSEAGDSTYACYYAWYGKNSLGTTHPVAKRLPNPFGLYDMAGNVFEWTNDWKTMYTGERITNSLGAHDPGNEYEKVIKGGSYNYPMTYLRPSHRSATYATMLSAANEYVGFRCARGAIPHGQYIGVRQTAFTPNSVTIMTNANDLLYSFLATNEAKLVFVNVTGSNRTLCYVDFGRTFPYVQEYSDDRNVYKPAISPDGRYVAYCGNNEGQNGPSRVSVRSLDSLNTTIVHLPPDKAYIPRWWINRVTGDGDTCIVYTNSGVDNTNQTWNETKTFLQKMSGGKAVGPAQELISNGSYHDGLSVNGEYAVTGYRRLMVKDVKTGSAEEQLFLSPQNGKDLTGSWQVCNVSMSPDWDTGSVVPRCLFLDFGYSGISTVTGCSYSQHQYLFISGMDGTIRNSIGCPSGEREWDNPSWTNQPRFAVGCGRNWADQAHVVYAIDLESRMSKQIVAGTELQQPYLLLSVNPRSFALDSLGAYNDPPTDAFQALFATKLLLYWQLFDSVEVVGTGSSQANWGFNPAMITGYKAFNMAAPGGDLLWQRVCIIDYLIKHCLNIKVICSTLGIGQLNMKDGGGSFTRGIGQSKGYRYDSSHAFWPGGVSSDFREIINHVPVPSIGDTACLGFVRFPSRGWGDSLPPHNPYGPWTIADSTYQKNLATINMIANTLRSKKIHWIMINYPVSPFYRNTDYYSFWGPLRQTAADILQQIRNIETSNQYFHIYNANMDGNHDYNDEDASDYDHLSGVGADKLTGRLDMLIDSILK